MDYLDTPAVHVDLTVAENNIRTMLASLSEQGIAHRPHIKAHKSVFLAKKQLAMGCQGITCAKLGEAEVMAEAGIDDILLAFPLIGDDKLTRYRRLYEKGIHLRTIINSAKGARELSNLGSAMQTRLPVLIELDGGLNRGGLKAGAVLEEFAAMAAGLPGIMVEGLEYYGGDIYALATAEKIRARAKKEATDVMEGAKTLLRAGCEARILSAGSSYSARFPAELRGISEVRAGNYLFNDGSLLSQAMVRPEDCALRVIATVVSRPDDHNAIMDAGSKTLTTDRAGGWEWFGYVVEDPAVEISKLNEEHGFLHSRQVMPFRVGDRISIIPNHACVVPNLADEIYGMRGGKLETIIKIDARGKNR